MAAFNDLRHKHDPPAAKLLGEARGLFQQGRRDEGLAKAKEIVEKYYASSSYGLARKWLAETEVIARAHFFSRNAATAAFISRSIRWARLRSRIVPWSRPGMISTTASLLRLASDSLRSCVAPSR